MMLVYNGNITLLNTSHTSILQMEFNLFDLLGQDDSEFDCQLPDALLSIEVPAPVTGHASDGYGLVPEHTGTTEETHPADTKTCPVPQCGKLLFSKTWALRRHWIWTHMVSAILFLCPVIGCTHKGSREDKVKAHAAQAHPAAFRDDADRKAQMAKLPRILVNNFKYIDPKDVMPPSCLGRVLEPSIPAGISSQPSLRPTHPSKTRVSSSISLPTGMKRKHVDPPIESYKIARTSSPLKPITIMNIAAPILPPSLPSLPSSTKLDATPRVILLKEYIDNEKLVIQLRKRNEVLRKEIKRQEQAEFRRALQDKDDRQDPP